MSELKLEWRTICGECGSREGGVRGDNRGIAWQRETEIDWTGVGWVYERGGRGTRETFDTTTSAHSRWSDISVLVSLLICMSSSLSRPSPLLILVSVRPHAASHRVRHPLSIYLSLSPSLPVVVLFVANHEIRVARCRAAPRRCFLSDQINPRLLCPRYRCVASPGRAVRPYKTRYYCNTERLIESFPDAFCGAVHYMRAHANFKRPRRPFLSRTDYSFFFFSPSFFSSIFFTHLSITLSSRFRRRATRRVDDPGSDFRRYR